jgi:hypothetical protein
MLLLLLDDVNNVVFATLTVGSQFFGLVYNVDGNSLNSTETIPETLNNGNYD